MRVACYIDGFNFYHSLDDLQKPHLKWVDLWALSKSLCRGGETLEKVAYFSAFATWRPEAYARHRQYVAALKNSGVECHMARFSEQKARCVKCGATWKRHEEKETDVHFSLTFLEDAIDDVFDRAIVISADGDHIRAKPRDGLMNSNIRNDVSVSVFLIPATTRRIRLLSPDNITLSPGLSP